VQHHFKPAGKANTSSSTSQRPYPEVRIVEHEGVGRPFAVETAAHEVAAAESVRATAKKTHRIITMNKDADNAARYLSATMSLSLKPMR
jgi:hypothetical protein